MLLWLRGWKLPWRKPGPDVERHCRAARPVHRDQRPPRPRAAGRCREPLLDAEESPRPPDEDQDEWALRGAAVARGVARHPGLQARRSVAPPRHPPSPLGLEASVLHLLAKPPGFG